MGTCQTLNMVLLVHGSGLKLFSSNYRPTMSASCLIKTLSYYDNETWHKVSPYFSSSHKGTTSEKGIRKNPSKEDSTRQSLRTRKQSLLPLVDTHPKIQPLNELELAKLTQLSVRLQELSPEYLTQFWVGLLDGDGSLQVNHHRKKSLCYRMILRLKYTPENALMRRVLARVVGGIVRLSYCRNRENLFVVWVVNHPKQIQKRLQIRKQYPPRTTRVQCQLHFMKQCWEQNPSIDWYLRNRDLKYSNRQRFVVNPLAVPYYKSWVSGFVEAQGCFSLKTCGSTEFSIGQKFDNHLLESFKTWTSSPNVRVRLQAPKKSPDQWILALGSRAAHKALYHHFQHYPLLGYKRVQFEELFNAELLQ